MASALSALSTSPQTSIGPPGVASKTTARQGPAWEKKGIEKNSPIWMKCWNFRVT